MQVFCTIAAKNGERVPIQVTEDASPTMFRQQVSEVTKIPLAQLRLIFRGRMIKDDDTQKVVEEYKLESECVLHCLGKPVEDQSVHTGMGTAANAVSMAAATAAATTTPSSSAAATTTASIAASAMMPSSSANAVAASVSGISTGSPPTLSDAISRLLQNNSPSVYETALTTLDKVLTNIVHHPMEEKYRSVKRQNAAFSRRLGGLVGGHECMLAVGFRVELDGGVEVYQLHASAEQWPKLLQAKKDIEQAVEHAKQQQQQQQPPTSSSNRNLFAANTGVGFPTRLPPGGGGAAFPSMDPNMQASMEQMMSNPESLRAALQVRMR